MAQIETGNSSGGKRNKLQKKILRVDFTPMVDMNMLLITFFMFCSTFAKPQIMDIAMPTRDNITPTDVSFIGNSKALTVILGENDKIYFYNGKPDYEDYSSLKLTDNKGFQEMLLQRNAEVVKEINELKKLYQDKKMTMAEFKQNVTAVKKSKETAVVIIRPTKYSKYENLVNVLDEMQICGVARYVIDDMNEGDQFLIDNFNSKGAIALNSK